MSFDRELFRSIILLRRLERRCVLAFRRFRRTVGLYLAIRKVVAPPTMSVPAKMARPERMSSSVIHRRSYAASRRPARGCWSSEMFLIKIGISRPSGRNKDALNLSAVLAVEVGTVPHVSVTVSMQGLGIRKGPQLNLKLIIVACIRTPHRPVRPGRARIIMIGWPFRGGRC